jgi:hypothetical protein
MIIVRYNTDSRFIQQMFHVMTELMNNAYPKIGINVFCEIIENGALIFFADLSDFQKFFSDYLKFNIKGYDYVIRSRECSPQDPRGKITAFIQITVEQTSTEVSKENIIDQITAVYEKVAEYITKNCKWNEKCNCIQVERLNPTSVSIISRREQDLCEMLPLIPFGKKMTLGYQTS